MSFIDKLVAFDIDSFDIHSIDNDQRKPAFRLFKSDALEFFTHITPQAVLAVWMPVILISLVVGVGMWPAAAPWWLFPVLFAFGFSLLWTFMEYILHRFLFHMQTSGRTMTQIVFLFHGIHHYQPHVKTRLVMPPVVSVPMALLFFALFAAVGGALGAQHVVLPLFTGTLLGYVVYDMIHYATHHLPMIGPVMKFLKRHHMEHHYKTPEARYGVTTDMWDRVFHTEPAR